nr:putative oxidoreductase [Quercus suber]
MWPSRTNRLQRSARPVSHSSILHHISSCSVGVGICAIGGTNTVLPSSHLVGLGRLECPHSSRHYTFIAEKRVKIGGTCFYDCASGVVCGESRGGERGKWLSIGETIACWGAGIAKALAAKGNFAVALLARRPEALQSLTKDLRSAVPEGVFEAFPTDTSPKKLRSAFSDIKAHPSFAGLKLRMAIYSIKNSAKKPFMTETHDEYMASLEVYAGGAMVFAQESLKRLFADHGEATLAEGAEKKGTIIFTGTLGALRCNSEFASYGATRASVRQLAQALAKEMSVKGVHVAHAVANGLIADVDVEQAEEAKTGKWMAAEAVGETYLWLHGQKPTVWTHELDMRPAQEKF